jgi:hypothetical protein
MTGVIKPEVMDVNQLLGNHALDPLLIPYDESSWLFYGSTIYVRKTTENYAKDC